MNNCQKRFPAFTLVELLIVIGIIAVLIGMLLPTLSKARIIAQEVRSQSGLRQMMLGYTMYYQDNKGAVLFGYTPSTVNNVPVTVTDPVSGQTFGIPVADRYPWRLVKYVGSIWQIIHSHGEMPAIPTATQTASQAFLAAYTLSLNPTYGINSVYVGGDTNYLGFVGADNEPNVNQHVVFKATEVHSPSTLIVFADCQIANVPSLAGQGLYTLTPPYAGGHNWQVTHGNINVLNPNAIMGLPQGWYSKRIMTAFFDGHVEARLPAQMEDMRLWANRAVSTTYDYLH